MKYLRCLMIPPTTTTSPPPHPPSARASKTSSPISPPPPPANHSSGGSNGHQLLHHRRCRDQRRHLRQAHVASPRSRGLRIRPIPPPQNRANCQRRHPRHGLANSRCESSNDGQVYHQPREEKD